MPNVCVFCGSSPGHSEIYVDAARRLARAVTDRGMGIVYGGASVGLMGAVADAALARGAKVHGVIPQALVDKELAHMELTHLDIVKTMHERKSRMDELSDAFVALPGGFGTLDELFEVVTWAQLGEHRKPCGVLNVGGYYDHLLEFIEHTVHEGFLKAGFRPLLMRDTTPEGLLDQFERYEPPDVHAWIGSSEV